MSDVDDTQPARPPWWVIRGDDIQDALRRAHAGEDPDEIYLQLYLDSSTEHEVDP